MYRVGISRPPRERTMDWKKKVCVALFAGSWFTVAVTSAVSAQEAADRSKAAAEADQHKATPQDADAAEAGAERERRQSTDAEAPAAIETDARIVTITPESPQARPVCRNISVTGTRFARRECRTAEEWAELQAQQSARGRRFARDVQGRSSVVPPPAPGQDTPEGRPSGLPNPAGL